jgi:hypothetical protein
MRTIHRRSLLTLLMLCAFCLSIMAPFASRADGAQVLQNEKWVAGAVTGSRAGAFAYYSLDYPGDKSVVTIELRFAPNDPVTKRGFNFNVYGPYGFFIGRGISVGDAGGDGVLQVQWSDENPATWLIQVYNYIPDHTVAYGIMAKPLPPPPAPPAPPAPAPRAGPPIPLMGAGYLEGRAGGTFAYYYVNVVAGGPDVQLLMTCWPDDANIANSVGFAVYGPQGEVVPGTTTGIAGERRAALSAAAPGVYRVQVYNYINGLNIQYMLRRQ